MTATPAYAICNPGRSPFHLSYPYFTGGTSRAPGSQTKTDARATIPYYTQYVDFAYGGHAAIWPMIQQTACAAGFAQAGEAQYDGLGYTRSFYEVENCGSITNGSRALPQFGPTTHTYVVSANGQFPSITQITVDGSSLFTAPGRTIDWVGNQTQFLSETQSNDDQNYGGYNNRQLLSNLRDGEWNGTSYVTHAVRLDEVRSTPFMANSLPVGATGYTTTSFRVWDTACAT